MSGGSFDKLPNETLQEIFHYSSAPDLASARLTCKTFRPITDELLFRERVLHCNVQSFQKLRELAASPVGVFLKRLIYSGRFLEDWSDTGVFEESPKRIRHNWNKDKIKTIQEDITKDDYHWDQYCRHVKSQTLMQSGDASLEELKRSLALFPNLREIEFHSGIEGCCKQPLPPSSFVLPIVPREGCRCDPETRRIAKDTLMYPRDEYGRKYHEKQLRALLAAAPVNPNITVLKLSYPSLDHMVRKGFWTPDASTSIGGFRHLTIGIHAHKTDSRGIEASSRRMSLRDAEQVSRGLHMLAELLTTATRLESLHAYCIFDRSTTNISRMILHGGNWPFLSSLTLQRISAPVLFLTNLLSSLAASLRRLRLIDFLLIGTNPNDITSTRRSWVSLIKSMRASLSLTNVQFDGSLKGDSQPGFKTHDPHKTCTVCTKSPKAPKDTLRYRIQDFILYGGSFSHHGLEGEAAWSALADRTTNDCTWKVLWG